jgi:phage portal protein BeeE
VNWWPWRKRAPTVTRQAWFEDIEQRAFGMDPTDSYFSFGGVGYQGNPGPAMARGQERMDGDFVGLVNGGLKSNSIIWSCERLRVAVFSELRFQFQGEEGGRPGELYGNPATRLDVLKHPWRNGTTGDLAARMLLHRDFAGNSYVVHRSSGLRVLRPDWVTIIMGSDEGPGDPNDVDAEIIGYAYWPGGFFSGIDPVLFLADEVAHFAPFPDPVAHYRGMSWLNPVITELSADQAATEHKLQFFRNGATTQTVVTVDKDISEEAFTRFMRKFNAETSGLQNAYKTVYVTGGADVKVVGADLRQLDFKVTQGAGETRIAAAAGTPPILVGLSEGLNAGQYNIYGQAKRAFVDGSMRPEWRNLCGSLETLVVPRKGSRLWYDDRDIAFLRDDQIDTSTILREKMSAIESGIRAGFEPDYVVDAIDSGDISLLHGRHTGLYSVQLQRPTETSTMDAAGNPVNVAAPQVTPNGKAPPPQVNGKQPAKAIGA